MNDGQYIYFFIIPQSLPLLFYSPAYVCIYHSKKAQNIHSSHDFYC